MKRQLLIFNLIILGISTFGQKITIDQSSVGGIVINNSINGTGFVMGENNRVITLEKDNILILFLLKAIPDNRNRLRKIFFNTKFILISKGVGLHFQSQSPKQQPTAQKSANEIKPPYQICCLVP